MSTLNKKAVVLFHAIALWVLCGATIGIAGALTTMETALIIHAIAAPVFAALISLFYYRRFNYTTPMQTAVIFLLFVMAVDAGIVAPVIEKSYDMFMSLLGTWIPFSLIFISTYVVGLLEKKNKKNKERTKSS